MKALVILLLAVSHYAHASNVATQRSLTKTVSLGKDSGTLVLRDVPGSEIVAIAVSWKFGSKDVAHSERAALNLALEAMTQGSKSFPRAKLISTLEDRGIALDCKMGVEISSCKIMGLKADAYLAFDILKSVIQEPEFSSKFLLQTRDLIAAEQKHILQSPDRNANELVNKIFYDEKHPYRFTADEALSQLTKISKKEVDAVHKKLLKRNLFHVVVVGSVDKEAMTQRISNWVKAIPSGTANVETVPSPISNEKRLQVERRDNPTSFMIGKFASPGAKDQRIYAADLLFEILSERLGDEVRTKRSLSYAVGAYLIPHTFGIGGISISTPKLAESTKVIADVIQELKEKPLADDDLNLFKNGYLTNYFLTIESHDSLAEALGRSLAYHGNVDFFYEMPDKIANVTAKEVHHLAKDIFGQKMKFGITLSNMEKAADPVDPRL